MNNVNGNEGVNSENREEFISENNEEIITENIEETNSEISEDIIVDIEVGLIGSLRYPNITETLLVKVGTSLMDKICLICLFNFINEERIRKLSCGHYYHLNCIDRWLTYKNNCPSCRRTVSLPGISYSAENLRSEDGSVAIRIDDNPRQRNYMSGRASLIILLVTFIGSVLSYIVMFMYWKHDDVPKH